MVSQKSIGYILFVFSVLLIVLLVFVKEDLDEQEVFLCSAVAEDPYLNMEDCPAHTSNSSWLILVSFGIAIILLMCGAYLIFFTTNKETNKKDFKDFNINELDNDEKEIYNILKENKGSVYQSDLIKKTNLSKVKITRILDKLESKKIIERKRRGMTNIIVLQ